MQRELARKSPAQIVKAAPGKVTELTGTTIIRDRNRTVVVQHVNRLYAAGAIRQDYRLALQGDVWVAAVALKPPASWFRAHGWKIVLAAAISGTTAGVLWLIVRAVTAAVTAMAVLLPYAGMVLGGLVVLGLLSVVFRGPSIEIIQKVRIR